MIFKEQEPNIKQITMPEIVGKSEMRFSLDQLPTSQRALCAEYARWAFVNPSFGSQQRNVPLYAVLLGFKPREALTAQKVQWFRDKGAPHVPTYAVEQALDIETAIIAWSPHYREKIDPERISWIEEEIRKLHNPLVHNTTRTVLETLAMVKLIEPSRPVPLTKDDWNVILSEIGGESVHWTSRLEAYSRIKIIDPARVPEIPEEKWQELVALVQNHKSGEFILKASAWLSILSSDGVISDEKGIRLITSHTAAATEKPIPSRKHL